MKEVEIFNPDLFISLLEESLQTAPVISLELQEKYKAFGKVTLEELNIRIAEYLYQKYDGIIVTSNDMVYGELASGERELLFNGTDCKVWLDASALRIE